jgi:hypothetical protein
MREGPQVIAAAAVTDSWCLAHLQPAERFRDRLRARVEVRVVIRVQLESG